MRDINSPELARNYGFWNEDEQRALLAARVAIAGVGGDGYQLGLKLAQQGVQNFSIADPEVFEPENTNRVPGAKQSTYGMNKAEGFRQELFDINPEAKVRIFTEGVTQDNVADFMSGATLLLDESELTKPAIGTMLARQARRQNIPNLLVMNIGFAAQATSFGPQARATFERFMGVPDGMPIDEINEAVSVDLSRCIAYIPPYLDLRTFRSVVESAGVDSDVHVPLPSIAQGVDVAAGLGGAQAFLHIVRGIKNHRPEPVWFPKVAYMDAYNVKSGVTRFPRLSHKAFLLRALAKNTAGINPRASYTLEDIQRRQSNAR